MTIFMDKETYCMGTNIFQRVFGENNVKAIHQVEEELNRLENMLSFYKDSSEVSLINQSAGYEYVHLSKETLHIIKKAKRQFFTSGVRRISSFKHFINVKFKAELLSIGYLIYTYKHIYII